MLLLPYRAEAVRVLRLQVVMQIAGVAASALTLSGSCQPASTCAAKCVVQSKQTALTAGALHCLLVVECISGLELALSLARKQGKVVHVAVRTPTSLYPRFDAAGTQGSIKLRRVDQFGNALTSSAGEPHFVCTSTGPESLDTQVVECGNGLMDIRRAYVLNSCRAVACHCLQGGRSQQFSSWGIIHAAPLACLSADVRRA